MPLLLAIDPGNVNGVSLVAYKPFQVHNLQQVNFDDLMDFLLALPTELDQVVVEDFRIRSGKNGQNRFQGQRMDVIKAIGQIEMWAKMRGLPVALQSPQYKNIGAKWSNVPEPKDHSQSHQIVAYNHAIYWLVKNAKCSISEVRGRKRESPQDSPQG